MSANGYRPEDYPIETPRCHGDAPIVFGKLCPCGASFMPHREAERYCSNACAGEYGTAMLPAAAPIERPRTARHAPPPAEPRKGPMDYGTPRAVERSKRWTAEHERTKFP